MPRLIKSLPLIVFILFSGVGWLLWWKHNNYETELVFRQTRSIAEEIAVRIEGMMNTRMGALQLLSERWIEREPQDFSKKRFVEFAEGIYKHFPGYFGIGWVSPSGKVQWVFPALDNRKFPEGIIQRINDIQKTNPVADRNPKGQAIITPCVELMGGKIGCYTIIPLIQTDRVQGYLIGMFQIERIMEIILAKGILSDYCIRVHEDGRLIFMNEAHLGPGSHPSENPVQVRREIQFVSKIWNLELIPATGIRKPGMIWDFAVFGFNISVALGVSLLLHLLINRMLLYRQAMDQARHEVIERKAVEKALRENEKKFEALLAELAAKNEDLEAFLFTVSHDLKTPVVTIEGFVRALREDYGDRLEADGDAYLNYIGEAAQKISQLINDLLDLSRIGRLPQEKTEFLFSEVVEETLHLLQFQIEQKKIRISVEPNLSLVQGDKKQLIKVLENLLSNAIKYIGEGNPSPLIEIGALGSAGRPVFFVRDNGIGIESSNFEKIFGIFHRLPDSETIGPGTGVGLTIVKRIVERHGGEIWLESEPGKGTTFYFSLVPREG